MDEQRTWNAYRLDVSSSNGLFFLIKENLIPFLDENDTRFWITNYYDPNQDMYPHIAFRVHVTSTEQIEVETFLDGLVEQRILLQRHPASDWDPHVDADNRIKGACVKINESGTQLVRPGYAPVPSSYLETVNPEPERIEELAALFEAVGAATKAFYKALPRKPIDPLVMSVTMHILFNSLTFNGPTYPSEETNIRFYPPI